MIDAAGVALIILSHVLLSSSFSAWRDAARFSVDGSLGKAITLPSIIWGFEGFACHVFIHYCLTENHSSTPVTITHVFIRYRLPSQSRPHPPIISTSSLLSLLLSNSFLRRGSTMILITPPSTTTKSSFSSIGHEMPNVQVHTPVVVVPLISVSLISVVLLPLISVVTSLISVVALLISFSIISPFLPPPTNYPFFLNRHHFVVLVACIIRYSLLPRISPEGPAFPPL